MSAQETINNITEHCDETGECEIELLQFALTKAMDIMGPYERIMLTVGVENEIESRIDTLMQPDLCNGCSGSGEGMADGTTCQTCKGRGDVPSAFALERCQA